MAQFCPQCGSKIDESWNVCPSCGTSIKSEPSIPSPVVTAPVYAAPQPVYAPRVPGPYSSNGLGTGALVCGILSIFLFGFVLGPIAIGLGAAGLRRDKDDGSAVAGLVLGIIGLICWIFVLVMWIAALAALSSYTPYYYPYY